MRALLGFILFYLRFGASFTALGFVARRLFWREAGADLSGKRVLVTGASGGIGRAVVSGCVDAGAEVIAVARDSEKLAGLVAEFGDRVQVEVVDLAEPREVAALCERLAADETVIDVLVNNVGVMLHDYARNSDGLDKQFAVNLLNQYGLTERLGADGVLANDASVITVSSGGMYMAPLVVAALATEQAEAHDGQRAYAVQKRAQVALTDHWSARSDGNRRYYVVHPGWVDTDGVKRSLPTFRRLLAPILRDAAQGADTILWLARTRPDTGPETIWFDRKARRTHAYGFTRERSQAIEDLLGFLDESIARWWP